MVKLTYQVQELVEPGNQMISVVSLVSNLVKHLQSQPHSIIVSRYNVCEDLTVRRSDVSEWHILNKIIVKCCGGRWVQLGKFMPQFLKNSSNLWV